MITNNLLFMNQSGSFVERKVVEDSFVFEPKEGEHLNVVFLLFDGKLDVQVNLINENASCDIKVIYLADEKKKIDIQLVANHMIKNTTSSQIIKGIATNEAQVDFYGKIYIAPNAIQTDGTQNHRAVLLSDKALIRSTPALEIYADDVKCAHGSATGALPEDALFYLMSRGIEKKKAMQVLLEAFINDLLPNGSHPYTNEWIKQNV